MKSIKYEHVTATVYIIIYKFLEYIYAKICGMTKLIFIAVLRKGNRYQ